MTAAPFPGAIMHRTAVAAGEHRESETVMTLHDTRARARRRSPRSARSWPVRGRG